MLDITNNITLAVAKLSEVIDLGNLDIRWSIDRTIPTAEARVEGPDKLLIVFNDAYEDAVIAAGYNRPEATAMHEIMHYWLRLGNPEFAGNTFLAREGDHFQRYFVLSDQLVPVDDHGHVMLPEMIMSGVWPVHRDTEQQASALELALLDRSGAHVWTATERMVNDVYRTVLHREADDAGRDWWVGELDSGRLAHDAFEQAFIAGIVP